VTVGVAREVFLLLLTGFALLDSHRRPRFGAVRSGRWERSTYGQQGAHAACSYGSGF
jgi:hypothetical protein